MHRPDIWFTVRILKGLKVTEVPLLKNWVHTLIMDVFTTCEYTGKVELVPRLISQAFIACSMKAIKAWERG